MTDAPRPSGVRVCVTGTGGYLGSCIAATLERRGATVERMSRATGFSLDRPPGADAFAAAGASALIHCAHDFSPRTWDDMKRLNVDGSIRLVDAARAAGVTRIVFVSSLAAYDGCASLYGRAKRSVEEHVARAGGTSIRPGTIWGPRPGGLMGSLASSVRGAGRFLPVVAHARPIYMAHEDDVARLAADLATGAVAGAAAPWFAAAPQPWLLPEIVRALGVREGRRPLLVRLPWRCVWAGLRSLEALGFALAFRSDSVLSLGRGAPATEIASLTKPPFDFRPFA